MYKYYRIQGKLKSTVGLPDEERYEELYGSYDLSEVRAEWDAEFYNWTEQGYKCLEIFHNETVNSPDPEIYGKDFKPDLV